MIIKFPLFFLCICLLSETKIYGWGKGHDVQVEIVFEHLPKQLKEKLTDKVKHECITHFSHYPDSFDPFNVDLVGLEAKKYLDDNYIKNRYGLHTDLGRAHAFILLCKALDKLEYNRAFFWISCLSHATGDMSAANHDPICHVANYDWHELRNYNPNLNLSYLLDLDWVTKTPEGKMMFSKEVQSTLLPIPDIDSSDEIIIDIMMQGHDGSRFCVEYGTEILRSALYVKSNTIEQMKLSEGLIKLGAYGAVRTIRDVSFALACVNSKKIPTITDEIKKKYKNIRLESVRNADIGKDGIYKGLIQLQNKGVGVVVEPTWRMNESVLGFSSRYHSMSICQRLKNEEIEYCTIDIRTLMNQDRIDKNKIPLLIFTSHQFIDYQGIDRKVIISKISKYMEDGGKIIWIAGNGYVPPFILDSLGVKLKKESLSGNKKWPIEPVEKFIKGELKLMDSPKSFIFLRTPDPKVGWQRPYCPYVFDTEEPLLAFYDVESGEELAVGVISEKVAFLPAYSIHPYLFKGSQILEFNGACLDEIGWSILSRTMDYLSK